MFTPDVSETLENVDPDPRDLEQESLNDVGSYDALNKRLKRKYAAGGDGNSESVAYVKCSIDDQFYMTPPIVKAPTHIWASDFTVSVAMSPPAVFQYKDELDCTISSGVPTKPHLLFGVNTEGPTGRDAAWIHPTEPLYEEYEATVKYPAAVNVLTKYGTAWRLKEIIQSPSQRLGEGYEDVLLMRETGVNYLSGVPISLGLNAAGSPGEIKTAMNPKNYDDGVITFGRKYDRYLDSWLVITEDKYLDPDNVYALITLPGKVLPVVEKRYCDGMVSSYQNVQLKSVLTQDVVRHYDFRYPAPKVNNPKKLDCDKLQIFGQLDYSSVSRAKKEHDYLIREAAGDMRKINFSAPSPVYPDIVALPLLSSERCYGPWQSANVLNVEADPRIRYSDIGGKVEFIKDENLAPWNFAGYQLLNEAGSLRAQLSNSLLLFSERGGFVYADYPSGIGLAKHLQNEGPLVTSIAVDVGPGGLKTTVKMDLYTSRFGKLQKQKEMAISQVARERQKIVDQNNAAIRRGLGKGQRNMNLFGSVMKNGGEDLVRLARFNPEEYTKLQKGDFGKKVSVIQNKMDQRTGNFVNFHSIEVDQQMVSELTSLLPDSKDHLWFDASTLLQSESDQNMVPYANAPYPNQVMTSNGLSQGRSVQQQIQPSTPAIFDMSFLDLD